MENLPSPEDLYQEMPLTLSDKDFVLKSRNEVADILEGKDPRKLLIVGPCSLHDHELAFEYAAKLKELSREVEDSFLIVMRAYYEKPRTSMGWKGMLHDPLMDGSHDIRLGLYKTRLLLKTLVEAGIPLATEFLDPAATSYFEDLISWGCIGARTTTSQIHRQLASRLPLPIAFKNTTDGNVEVAVNAINVAKNPHTFLGMNKEGKLGLVKSKGNPFAHLVLRGSELEPNFSSDHVGEALTKTPYLLVDCSHDNSRKQPQRQISVFENVISQIKNGNLQIRGMMLESSLFEGNQPLGSDLKYGVSITDACLDFETTEHIIREAALLQPCLSIY